MLLEKAQRDIEREKHDGHEKDIQEGNYRGCVYCGSKDCRQGVNDEETQKKYVEDVYRNAGEIVMAGVVARAYGECACLRWP